MVIAIVTLMVMVRRRVRKATEARETKEGSEEHRSYAELRFSCPQCESDFGVMK
jgi:hypothetical protein